MATLKISDLSVGDWVRYEDNIYKLYAIEECGLLRGKWESDEDLAHIAKHIDYFYPIPITAEILEKIGFESPSNYWSIYKDNGGYIEIWEDEGRWYLSVNSVEFILCDLHWVHQIQHLMRVWGFDKEINL